MPRRVVFKNVAACASVVVKKLAAFTFVLRRARLRGDVGLSVARKTPDAARLPEAKEQNGRRERDHAADDVNEVAVNEVRPEELRERERDSDDEHGGQDFKSLPPPDHRAHEPEGNENGCEGKYATDHRVQV